MSQQASDQAVLDTVHIWAASRAQIGALIKQQQLSEREALQARAVADQRLKERLAKAVFFDHGMG